jgi:DNA invertase Pin-like site-specific DNA recombinase
LICSLSALKKAGCERVITDKASGSSTERLGLDQAFEQLRSGDVLVVWRLDRLGRSLRHLIGHRPVLADRGVGFQSITEHIDTTTSGGKLVFHLFGALAEFEGDIIRERTQAGLQAARARGRRGGRPKRPPSSKKVEMAKRLYASKSLSASEICRSLGISRATPYRYIKEAK